MSVPNHFAIVQQVYQSGHYDLTTKIGAGRFTEDAVWALHQHDVNWRHLKKPNHLGGANHWNHHAVDNACYFRPTPGQCQAVDIVGASESTDAHLTWNPDQPRYNPEDLSTPTGPDRFNLPTHQCRLGASLFWLLGGVKFHPDQVERNLSWLAHDLHADYIRAFFCCTGVHAWSLIGSDPRWPDFDAVVAHAVALCQSYGLRIAWTLVGERAGCPTSSEQIALCDRFLRLVEPSSIELVEIWNERKLTGGDDGQIRAMAAHLRPRLASAIPIALDTPHYAMVAPTGEGADPLPGEVSSFYRGSAADAITPQWDRSQPNPREMGPDAPRIVYAHEPRGPGASAGGDVSDPLPLVHDYVQAAIASRIHGFGPVDYRGYTAHSMPGAWGGHCHPDFPAQNRYANWFDVPNAAEIAAALSHVRAGKLPDVPGQPGDGDNVPLKSREQFFAEFNDINAFYADPTGLQRPGGMVIDTAVPVPADTEAMAAWGYDLMRGLSVNDVKHQICQSQEWRSKHQGEVPPF